MDSRLRGNDGRGAGYIAGFRSVPSDGSASRGTFPQTRREIRLAPAGRGRGDEDFLGAFGRHPGGESVRDLDAPRQQHSAHHAAPSLRSSFPPVPPTVPARTPDDAANAAADRRPVPSPLARPTPSPHAPAPHTSPPSAHARSTRRESPPPSTPQTRGSPRPTGTRPRPAGRSSAPTPAPAGGSSGAPPAPPATPRGSPTTAYSPSLLRRASVE